MAADNPNVMAKMQELADQAVATLGNEATEGSEQRAALTLDASKPMTLPTKQ